MAGRSRSGVPGFDCGIGVDREKVFVKAVLFRLETKKRFMGDYQFEAEMNAPPRCLSGKA